MKMALKITGLIVLSAVIVYGINLLILAKDVAKFQKFWSEQNDRADTGDLRYIALGDSTAQSIGASDPMKGYVGIIANRLSQKSGKDVSITNLSKSGATVRMAIDEQLPRLKELPLSDSTVITIEIGANNMPIFDEEDFAKEIDELFSQLPPQTVVSDMPYFGGGRRRALEKNVVPANKIIYNTASKYNLRVAPLHAITKERENWRVHSVDLFHPSNSGYANWADAFWSVLEP